MRNRDHVRVASSLLYPLLASLAGYLSASSAQDAAVVSVTNFCAAATTKALCNAYTPLAKGNPASLVAAVGDMAEADGSFAVFPILGASMALLCILPGKQSAAPREALLGDGDEPTVDPNSWRALLDSLKKQPAMKVAARTVLTVLPGFLLHWVFASVQADFTRKEICFERKNLKCGRSFPAVSPEGQQKLWELSQQVYDRMIGNSLGIFALIALASAAALIMIVKPWESLSETAPVTDLAEQGEDYEGMDDEEAQDGNNNIVFGPGLFNEEQDEKATEEEGEEMLEITSIANGETG